MNTAGTIATVALAVVAAIALIITASSTSEAYRSRINGVAQRVVVSKFENVPGVEMTSISGNLQPLSPGDFLKLPEQNDELLTVTANLTISNEGSVTAFARINDDELIVLGNWKDENTIRLTGLIQPAVQEGWVLVPPGVDVVLSVRRRRPAKEWHLDLLRSSSKAMTRTFSLEIRDATGSALDVCSCEFGQDFMRINFALDRIDIMPILEPSERLNNVETVGLIKRTYPLESFWYRWNKKQTIKKEEPS